MECMGLSANSSPFDKSSAVWGLPDQKVQTGIKIPDKPNDCLGRGPFRALRPTAVTCDLYLTHPEAGILAILASLVASLCLSGPEI